MIAPLNNRPLFCLTLLLVANLLLLSFQVQNERGTSLASASLAIEAPAANMLNFLRSNAVDFFRRYIYLVDTETSNQSLRLENRRLLLEIKRLLSLTEAAKRIKNFDRLASISDFDTTTASVIQRGPPFLGSVMVVNAGRNQGIRENSAVIVPEGVVGRVQTSGLWTSRVEPIINPQAAVGAVLGGSRNLGVIRGDVDGSLRLHYIPHSVEVAAGDTVLTSGMDGIYPKGLPIGRVTSVKQGNEIHQKIRVDPTVDFNRIEETLILRARALNDLKDRQDGKELTASGKTP